MPPSRKGKSACDKNNYYLAAVSALTDGKEVTVTRKMMHRERADKLQQMGGVLLDWNVACKSDFKEQMAQRVPFPAAVRCLLAPRVNKAGGPPRYLVRK